MDSTVIGKNIRRYRIQKDMTQKELADRLGVTMQAVSKWERGGVPDVTILPELSSALNVSIDALFGLSDSIKNDALRMVTYDLKDREGKDRFERAYDICWAAVVNTCGSLDALTQLMDVSHGFPAGANGSNHLSLAKSRYGAGTSNLAIGSQFIFLMKQLGSFEDTMALEEDYIKLFYLLSKKETMKVIRFLMTCQLECPITETGIIKGADLNPSEAKKTLVQMEENHILKKQIILTEEGKVPAYYYDSAMHKLVPVFLILKGLIHQDQYIMNLSMDAEPYMKQ